MIELMRRTPEGARLARFNELQDETPVSVDDVRAFLDSLSTRAEAPASGATT